MELEGEIDKMEEQRGVVKYYNMSFYRFGFDVENRQGSSKQALC